jgi:hypothetical protein
METLRQLPERTVEQSKVGSVLGHLHSGTELVACERAGVQWLWDGYIGKGMVSLLTSFSKSGKTTLVSVLLATMRDGGVLGGKAVAQARALVVSEEAREVWAERCKKLAIGEHVHFLCRPFIAKPDEAGWTALMAAAAEVHESGLADLVVIDTLAAFSPARNENTAAGMLDVLMPLQALTARGMAVLLLHHPRKAKSVDGQAARGSGALSSFVDVIVEMNYGAAAALDDRSRRILAFSRWPNTPRHRLLKLAEDGMGYDLVTEDAPEVGGELDDGLLDVLQATQVKLDRFEILERWPDGARKPSEATLWRLLEKACEVGLVRKEGTGKKGDPFLYWLPEREAFFFPGEGSSKERLAEWDGKVLAEVLPARGKEVQAE